MLAFEQIEREGLIVESGDFFANTDEGIQRALGRVNAQR